MVGHTRLLTARRGLALTAAWRPSKGHPKKAIHQRMRRLARRLEVAYQTPDLGNLADPLDETVYILLTYQTDIPRAQEVWRALRAAFPSWQAVLEAREDVLSEVLRPSGFHRSRARLIKNLLHAIRSRWGLLSLDGLKDMGDEDAEAELRALPGMEIKGARCVLLYSLGRRVFPVDSNAYRFMQRYGILKRSARYRRRSTHDDLQDITPPTVRRSLHVNLVVHGQQTCLPRHPRCDVCPVQHGCETGNHLAGGGTRHRSGMS